MAVTEAVTRPKRDLRLDFFRGLALFLIFIDHIPGNFLSYFTLRSIGFSDAAEAFIFISGYAASMVYGALNRQYGFLLALAQIYRRVWQLYVAHVFLFVIYLAEVSYTLDVADNPLYAEEMGVGDFLKTPHIAVMQALLLRFQPTFLDILPLYIVLLAGFPLVLLLLRRHVLLALVPSFALYVCTQTFGWAMHAYPGEHRWYFNPFAWQFLFTLGAVCSELSANRGRPLPTLPWLQFLAFAIAGTGAIVSLSWLIHSFYDGFPALLAQVFWRGSIDKTNLSPVRLVDFLALALVATTIIPRESAFFSGKIARPIVICGQNSLYIFCLGILLAVLGHFVLAEVSDRPAAQIAVNLAGAAAMIAVGAMIAWYKKAGRNRAKATAPGPAG